MHATARALAADVTPPPIQSTPPPHRMRLQHPTSGRAQTMGWGGTLRLTPATPVPPKPTTTQCGHDARRSAMTTAAAARLVPTGPLRGTGRAQRTGRAAPSDQHADDGRIGPLPSPAPPCMPPALLTCSVHALHAQEGVCACPRSVPGPCGCSCNACTGGRPGAAPQAVPWPSCTLGAHQAAPATVAWQPVSCRGRPLLGLPGGQLACCLLLVGCPLLLGQLVPSLPEQ